MILYRLSRYQQLHDKESKPPPVDKGNVESFRKSPNIYEVGCTRSI